MQLLCRCSLALLIFLVCSASAGSNGIPLSELGTIPRTALNDELLRLAKGFPSSRPRLPRIKSDARRKTDAVSSTFSPELIYNSILEYAWDFAHDGGFSRSPFLICAHITEELLALLPGDTDEEKILEIAIPADGRDDTCFIVAISAEIARSIMPATNSIQPLSDIMKIESGLIEDLMTSGWEGYEEGDGWETGWKVLQVKLAPTFEVRGGDGDAALRRAVNEMVMGVQAMGVKGDYVRRGADDRAMAQRPEPPLGDTFSVTSVGRRDPVMARNRRVDFWEEVLVMGMEAPHNCRHIETIVRVGPLSEHGWRVSFDLLLTPTDDGVGSITNNSPYANEACMLSLIMGLSTHPGVLWISMPEPEEEVDES